MRWSGSIGAKFSRIVPAETAAVVVLTLVSQVSILLAFFLPLKVIILLGSTGIPRYFPSAFADYDRHSLVVWLSVAAVAFYVLHLLSEWLIKRAVDRGAMRLMAHSRKMVLFERQEEVAETGYQKYAQALASSVFVGLAFAVLVAVYPRLATLASGYTVLAAAGILAGAALQPGLRNTIAEWLGPALGVMSAIGFLGAFAFLVADFLLWEPPGLIVAIVSMLLVRQVFRHLVSLVKDLETLYARRVKLNALFFHNQVLLPDHKAKDGDIWALLAPGARLQWVLPLLSDLAEAALDDPRVEWHQSGFRDVAVLRVFDLGKGDDYLVKLFSRKRRALALHEATLYAEMAKDAFPGLPFLGVTVVDDHQCHVFDRSGVVSNARELKMMPVLFDLLERLLLIAPPMRMVRRYMRSHPVLWERLDDHVVERMALAVNNDQERSMMSRFASELEGIRSILKGLPLTIVNPDINPDTVAIDAEGRPRVFHWARWALEPMGAFWPLSEKSLGRLDSAVDAANGAGVHGATVQPAHVRLSAVLCEIEQNCRRQRYRDAIELTPAVFAALEEKPGADGAGLPRIGAGARE